MRANNHSFKEQFFKTLLCKLTNVNQQFVFDAVEVYFAVPSRKLTTFQPKTTVLDVQNEVLEPAGLNAGTTKIAVEVVGLAYTEYSQSGGFRLGIKRGRSG
ncbi:unnamed protein product [Phytophthora lilii]|uniref:Unnamed protein product n=1 Tax=Phytophthora lilii TaxID=2077276 RepID=A0A9W6X0Z8_9STRA|nr:unnamed protein product [Phytophthora lilii]